MLKNLAIVIFVALPAFFVAKYFDVQKNPEPQALTQNTEQTQQVQKLAVKQPVKTVRERPLTGRKARIKMDSRGHFQTDARMNGRRIPVLVDTGATSVAINTSTARRMGIRLSPKDFKYKVNTANGTTKAAATVIKRVEIGRVRVNNVRAMVLDDKSLKGTLLGMSFLGELKSFGVRNRELILEQ